MTDLFCLTGCGRKAVSRGLCHAHYMAALRVVKRGETTWERLEARKKVLPRWAQYDKRNPFLDNDDAPIGI